MTGSGAGPGGSAGEVPEVPVPSRPAVAEVPEQVTASVRVEGFPAAHLPVLFDGVFSRLFPVLGQAGAQPVGAAFALYPRVPADTVDLEVGIPVDRVLDGDTDLGTIEVPVGAEDVGAGEVGAQAAGADGSAGAVGATEAAGTAGGSFALVARASALPGGRVATAAHLGGYDRLGEAWQTFMGALEAQGLRAAVPFWEVYTTEPSPEMDPATLRTDLFTVLED